MFWNEGSTNYSSNGILVPNGASKKLERMVVLKTSLGCQAGHACLCWGNCTMVCWWWCGYQVMHKIQSQLTWWADYGKFELNVPSQASQKEKMIEQVLSSSQLSMFRVTISAYPFSFCFRSCMDFMRWLLPFADGHSRNQSIWECFLTAGKNHHFFRPFLPKTSKVFCIKVWGAGGGDRFSQQHFNSCMEQWCWHCLVHSLTLERDPELFRSAIFRCFVLLDGSERPGNKWSKFRVFVIGEFPCIWWFSNLMETL